MASLLDKLKENQVKPMQNGTHTVTITRSDIENRVKDKKKLDCISMSMKTDDKQIVSLNVWFKTDSNGYIRDFGEDGMLAKLVECVGKSKPDIDIGDEDGVFPEMLANWLKDGQIMVDVENRHDSERGRDFATIVDIKPVPSKRAKSSK